MAKKAITKKKSRGRRVRSPFPRLTLEEQACRAPIINAICAEADKVLPRNGETMRRFKKRTGRSDF